MEIDWSLINTAVINGADANSNKLLMHGLLEQLHKAGYRWEDIVFIGTDDMHFRQKHHTPLPLTESTVADFIPEVQGWLRRDAKKVLVFNNISTVDVNYRTRLVNTMKRTVFNRQDDDDNLRCKVVIVDRYTDVNNKLIFDGIGSELLSKQLNLKLTALEPTEFYLNKFLKVDVKEFDDVKK